MNTLNALKSIFMVKTTFQVSQSGKQVFLGFFVNFMNPLISKCSHSFVHYRSTICRKFENLQCTMPRLSLDQRWRAIGMLQAGCTQIRVAREIGATRSQIHRLWVRYRETSSTNDRPRPGRPRVTTLRQDRYIRIQHLRNRFRTASATAANTWTSD